MTSSDNSAWGSPRDSPANSLDRAVDEFVSVELPGFDLESEENMEVDNSLAGSAQSSIPLSGLNPIQGDSQAVENTALSQSGVGVLPHVERNQRGTSDLLFEPRSTRPCFETGFPPWTKDDLKCFRPFWSETMLLRVLLFSMHEPVHSQWPQQGDDLGEKVLRDGFFVGDFVLGDGIEFGGATSNKVREIAGSDGYGVSMCQKKRVRAETMHEKFGPGVADVQKVVFWSSRQPHGFQSDDWKLVPSRGLYKNTTRALYLFVGQGDLETVTLQGNVLVSTSDTGIGIQPKGTKPDAKFQEEQY